MRQQGANPDLAADILELRHRFLQKMVQEGLLEPTESKDSYRVSCQQLLPLFQAAMLDSLIRRLAFVMLQSNRVKLHDTLNVLTVLCFGHLVCQPCGRRFLYVIALCTLPLRSCD